MISFRVSESEFQQLKSESELRGAGSVSDYARLSLCGERADHPTLLASRINELGGDLRNLQVHVDRLTAVVESTHDAVVQAGGTHQQGGGPDPTNQDARTPAGNREN